MHTILSYRGNRPTNKHSHKPTNRQERLQYTTPLSLTRSVIITRLTRSVEITWSAGELPVAK